MKLNENNNLCECCFQYNFAFIHFTFTLLFYLIPILVFYFIPEQSQNAFNCTLRLVLG
jgi:hypothetical protein